VVDQIRHAEPASQGEAVAFAAQLIADHVKILSQQPCQGAKQLHPARQSRHQHQRRAPPPLSVFGPVVFQMCGAGTPFAWTKLGSACLQPFQGCLHARTPFCLTSSILTAPMCSATCAECAVSAVCTEHDSYQKGRG